MKEKRPITNICKKNLGKGIEKEKRNVWIRFGLTGAKICNRVQGYKGACTSVTGHTVRRVFVHL